MGMLREPSLNKRLVDKRLDVAPIPQAHAEALHRWAASIRKGGIFSQTETGIRRPFLQMLFVDILGYTDFGSGVDWTLKDETSAGRGSMDVALGRFGAAREEIVAPFELKGPRTTELDAIMPAGTRAPCSRPGNTRWTRPAAAMCWCPTCWRYACTPSAMDGRPTKSGTCPT